MRLPTALALLMLPAVPAMAQTRTESRTGSHIGTPTRARIADYGSQDPVVQARLVMAEFARCTVDREYGKVGRAVALPVGEDFNRAVAALATPGCLDNGMMKFKATAMRGPLFKELFVRRTAAEARGANWGPSVTRVSLTPTSGLDPVERQQAAVMEFGACVVAANRDGARNVILAPTASDAQDKAIAALVPAMGPCLPEGSQVRLGKQAIEATLAEVLYRGVEPSVPAVTAAVESK